MKKINLSKWLKSLLSLTLITALLVTTGCDEDDGPAPTDESAPTQTLYELISADPNLTTFLGYIDADAELAEYVKGTAPYTIFAPNNAAFTTLQTTLGVTSLEVVASSIIDDALRFHFAAGSSSLASITGKSIATVQGENVVVNGTGTIATGGSNSNVKVSDPDIAATNGTLHVVEAILIPPTLFRTIGLNLGTVAQPFLLGAAFTDILGVIRVADSEAPTNGEKILTMLAQQPGTYTVFLPANAVLEGTAAVAGITKEQLIASLTTSPAAARGFLLNQISNTEVVKGAELVAGKMITMMSGAMYTVVVSPANPTTNPLGITLFPVGGDQMNLTKYAPVFFIDLVNVNETGAGNNGSAHAAGVLQQP